MPVVSKKRRGPKPKPIEERPWSVPKPIQRTYRRYSRRKKVEALLFLYNHRIPLEKNEFDEWIKPTRSQIVRGMPNNVEEGFRRPFLQEVAAYFKISSGKCISDWWSKRQSILAPSPRASKETREEAARVLSSSPVSAEEDALAVQEDTSLVGDDALTVPGGYVT